MNVLYAGEVLTIGDPRGPGRSDPTVGSGADSNALNRAAVNGDAGEVRATRLAGEAMMGLDDMSPKQQSQP
jgi:hypothetical protein